MNSAVGNHPWEKKPANQDEFRGRKSSLREEICKSGCIAWSKSNPGMSVSSNKDEPGILQLTSHPPETKAG